MKKSYVTPDMEILRLEQSDIITGSGEQGGFPGVDDTSGPTLPWDDWD